LIQKIDWYRMASRLISNFKSIRHINSSLLFASKSTNSFIQKNDFHRTLLDLGNDKHLNIFIIFNFK
jgi:hypothetical protein